MSGFNYPCEYMEVDAMYVLCMDRWSKAGGGQCQSMMVRTQHGEQVR